MGREEGELIICYSSMHNMNEPIEPQENKNNEKNIYTISFDPKKKEKESSRCQNTICERTAKVMYLH